MMDLLPAQEFQCRRCLACCRQPGYVYLSSDEAERVAVGLGMSPFDFVNQFCDLLDRQKLVLKKREDESCIFLEGADCRIHAFKPGQCRDFPLRWRTPRSYEYCSGLRAMNLPEAVGTKCRKNSSEVYAHRMS